MGMVQGSPWRPHASFGCWFCCKKRTDLLLPGECCRMTSFGLRHLLNSFLALCRGHLNSNYDTSILHAPRASSVPLFTGPVGNHGGRTVGLILASGRSHAVCLGCDLLRPGCRAVMLRTCCARLAAPGPWCTRVRGSGARARCVADWPLFQGRAGQSPWTPWSAEPRDLPNALLASRAPHHDAPASCRHAGAPMPCTGENGLWACIAPGSVQPPGCHCEATSLRRAVVVGPWAVAPPCHGVGKAEEGALASLTAFSGPAAEPRHSQLLGGLMGGLGPW